MSLTETITGPQIIVLSLRAAVRRKLRSRNVGPFETFDHATAWVDDNLEPDDDYVISPLSAPATVPCGAAS